MILHYLKIAWRNLLKYRMQSFVNIFGLAVGFACFALSAMWMIWIGCWLCLLCLVSHVDAL